MKIVAICANPNINGLNNNLFRSICKGLELDGHNVKSTDLYNDWNSVPFDPILMDYEIPANTKRLNDKFREKCNDLAEAEGLVIVHPNWWDAPPAILKGYVDRVFRPRVAFTFNNDKPVGLLGNIKMAYVLTTANTPSTPLRPQLRLFWKDVFRFCGIHGLYYGSFDVLNSTRDEKTEWMDRQIREIRNAYSI